MKKILFIAQNTARELIRDKVLYVMLFFAMALIAISLLLSQLSANQNLRLTIDFGLSCILLSSCTITLFIGGTLVFREIDKKTILFLMAYPITRTQFLFGKFLGFVEILIIILFGLGLMLGIMLLTIGWDYNMSYLIGLYGIFLEMLILLSFTILLGTIMKPILVIACGIGLFLIGHGVDGFYIIAHTGKSIILQYLSTILNRVLPNLENMNWMNHVVYNEVMPASSVIYSTLYTIGWVILFLSIATILFRRKDFV